MTNLKKCVDNLASTISSNPNESVVLRFDNRTTFDAVKNYLQTFEGYILVNGTIKDFNRAKSEKAIVIVADPLQYSQPTLAEYQKLAQTHNCGLIFLECLGGLGDEEFENAKVVRCNDERALTAGNLIEQLAKLNKPASIVVYNTDNGLFFAGIAKNSRGFFSETLNSVVLQPELFEAITVERFTSFLKTLPSDTILSVIGLGIIKSVTDYRHNVVHLSTTKRI